MVKNRRGRSGVGEGALQESREPGRRDWRRIDSDAEVAKRVLDGVRDRGRR